MSKELIDALGGVKAVAEQLNTSPGAVANWRLPERSIPWRWRPALAELAAKCGVSLPAGFLSPSGDTLHHTPPRTIVCAECSHEVTASQVGRCDDPDCPHAVREAA